SPRSVDPARGRTNGRGAACLVEFRVELGGAHRTGQGRLEGRTLREGAGRRDRVHSAAGGTASVGQLPVVAGRSFGARGKEMSYAGRAEARRAEPGNLAGSPARSL